MNKSFLSLLALFAGITLAQAQATKPAPPTPIDEKKAELGGTPWNPDWDQIIEKAIPAELLSSQAPRGVVRFCPRFFQMAETDKRTFWAYLFQALAGAEAGLNPKASVRHGQPEDAEIDEVTKKPIRTEGLLQLAYADQKRYGCDFDWEKDRALAPKDPNKTILQPKNNLECGIKILFNQTITQHKPLLARTSYWSTLQPGNPTYPQFAKQMTNPPAPCASPIKTKIDKAATTKTVQTEAQQKETPK
jgi:hypothetical protein